jgi:hypothetical protein
MAVLPDLERSLGKEKYIFIFLNVKDVFYMNHAKNHHI